MCDVTCEGTCAPASLRPCVPASLTQRVTHIQLKYREYERARALGMYIINQGNPRTAITYSHESSPLLAVRHGARGLVGLRALIGNL
jgi:hypothetical protein